RSIDTALRPARRDRSAASAIGTSQAANRGPPTQIATTSGTAAGGAGANMAAAHRATLTSVVIAATIRTSWGRVRWVDGTVRIYPSAAGRTARRIWSRTGF